MATRYWVGGDGTWDSTSTTNWSATSGGSGGASAPVAADTVNFDVAGTFTVTIASSAVASIVFADANYTFSLSGSADLGTNARWFQTRGTISLNGYTLSLGSYVAYGTNAVAVAFGGGSMVLARSSAELEINTNSFSYTGTFSVSMTDTGSGQRNIFLASTYFTESTAPSIGSGSGNINITDGNTGQLFVSGSFRDIAATGFTGQIAIYPVTMYGNLAINSNGTFTSAVGGAALTFAATSGTQTMTANNASIGCPLVVSSSKVQVVGGTTINNSLTFTSGTLELTSVASVSVTSFITTGTTLKYLQSTSALTRATLSDSSGTNTVTYLSIKDIAATGGATWDATSPTNVNAGNVTGWNFGAPSNIFFLL